VAALDKKITGDAAEAIAANFLARHGVKVMAQNFRCRFGEIDLIARDGDTLVFVEVRMRQSSQFGGAGASITVAKQRRIALAAEHYLSQLKHVPACRFDAILLNKLDIDNVEWIKDAFSL
jgi:putative endonuclease